MLMLWLLPSFAFCPPPLRLVAGPKGGTVSGPQNPNLVCSGCFAAEAERGGGVEGWLEPRLDMRDKGGRPIGRSLAAAAEGRSRGLTDTVPFFP